MSGKNLPGGLIQVKDNGDGTLCYVFDKFCIFEKGYINSIYNPLGTLSKPSNTVPVFNYGTTGGILFDFTDNKGDSITVNQAPVTGNYALTFPAINTNDTLVTTNLAQTLTNKTFTSPTLSAPILSGICTGTIQSSSQPLFDVGLNASVTDVTGSGTKYNVVFNSISNLFGSGIFDTTTGGYTVEVAGYYHISTFLQFSGITSSNTDFQLLINVNGAYYYTLVEVENIAGSGGLLSISGAMDRQCAVGDVIYLSVQVSGSTTNNVGITAGSGQTRFWGYMITPTP